MILQDVDRVDQPTAQVQVSLEHFAEQINAEHRACCAAVTKSLEHAVRCGELLLQAKAAVPHGGWQPWLKQHFPASNRTARQYMRLANHRDEIEAKRHGSAVLGIDEAVKLIAATREAPADPWPDDYHDDHLPPIDGRPYVLFAKPRRQVQIWPSQKHPGHYYVSEVEWLPGDDEGGIQTDTRRPVRLNHSMLKWIIETQHGLELGGEWVPLGDKPLLPLPFGDNDRDEPRPRTLAETVDDMLASEKTRQSVEALVEIRDRKLYVDTHKTFEAFVSGTWPDAAEAMMLAIDVLSPAKRKGVSA